MALQWRYSTGDVPNYSWTDIVYGNGTYIAVAGDGSSGGSPTASRIITSTDADTWTIRTAPSVNSWQKVCYGHYNNTTHTYVAVSSDGTNRCIRSTNGGASWSSSSTTPNNTISWTSVCFGNNRFVAVGLQNGTTPNVAYSDDGGNVWISIAGYSSVPLMNPTQGWKDIAFGNNRFIAITSTYVMICTGDPRNASNWTFSSTLPSPAYQWNKIRYVQNNTFIATGISFPRNMITYDGGTTWNVGLVPLNSANNYTNTWQNSAGGNNLYVTVGRGNASALGLTATTISWNGDTSSNWIIESTPGGTVADWRSIIFGNNNFVAVGINSDTSGKRVMIGNFYTSQTILTNFPNINGPINTSQTLVVPTSNQPEPQGAITYSSNNPSVAGISGSTIIFGATAGFTAMITATQAPTTTFSGASIYAIVTLTGGNQSFSDTSNKKNMHFIPSLSFI